MSDRHLEVVRFVELKSSLVFEIRFSRDEDAARAAILVLKDALNKEDVNKISESLPDDYLTLFSE
ncbi:MAG: hypothetical protein ACOC36_06895 [Fibrobacterota bacterium]